MSTVCIWTLHPHHALHHVINVRVTSSSAPLCFKTRWWVLFCFTLCYFIYWIYVYGITQMIECSVMYGWGIHILCDTNVSWAGWRPTSPFWPHELNIPRPFSLSNVLFTTYVTLNSIKDIPEHLYKIIKQEVTWYTIKDVNTVLFHSQLTKCAKCSECLTGNFVFQLNKVESHGGWTVDCCYRLACCPHPLACSTHLPVLLTEI